MRRYFKNLRTRFKGNFRGFLRFTIYKSRYNRFAIEYFSYYIGGYIFKGDYKAL